MAQLFVDVIIKNTTNNGKSDHFWDACEMNLLKAWYCMWIKAMRKKTATLAKSTGC